MKLWLDDLRIAPEGWSWAKTVDEAMGIARVFVVDEMSLDHDLGLMSPCGSCQNGGCSRYFNGCLCPCHTQLQPTGYDFVKWMCETGRWPVIKPRVHSMNPVGRDNMQALIERYWEPPGDSIR